MTRIALVSPFTLPFVCGNSILAQRLMSELTVRGHVVRLFDISADDPADGEAFEPDIVHSLHGLRPGLWLMEAFGGLPCSQVVTFTGTDYRNLSRDQRREDQLAVTCDNADALVVFHDEARQALVTVFPQAEAKIQVIAQGVPSENHAAGRDAVRRKYGIADGQVVFLMAAGIRPVKNIGSALNAFLQIIKQVPQARLLLAGPVIDEKEASTVLALGKTMEAFSYLGVLRPADVRELMSAVDIFLNTSLHEGMPGAVLEAMAEGLPVIATDTSGNRNVVRHGHSGFLVDNRRSESLIDASVRLASDRAGRLRMGNAARRIILENYSVSREIDRYDVLYKTILM